MIAQFNLTRQNSFFTGNYMLTEISSFRLRHAANSDCDFDVSRIVLFFLKLFCQKQHESSLNDNFLLFALSILTNAFLEKNKHG